MPKFLYKYVGPHNIDHVLSDTGASFKCSLPKDFNDPYELFLTIDFKQGPEALAFYNDVIGEMPQLPTTCFSRSPAVIPMWAHYAANHEGFAVEVNEDRLAATHPDVGFGDVDYQDRPHDAIQESLAIAYHTAKFRHVYRLSKAIFSSAYFTKNACWSYENERRAVLKADQVRESGGHLLLDVPAKCIRSLICGARASPQTRAKLRERAAALKCHCIEVQIGRSSSDPYFVNQSGRTYLFTGTSFERAKKRCSLCKEPVDGPSRHCSWCRINDGHKNRAARQNGLRTLAAAGLLESYLQGMEKITRRSPRR